MYLATEPKTVEASILPRTMRGQGPFDVPDDQRTWKPASEVFDPKSPALEDGYLAVYRSSPGRSRWFCQRCGTGIAYGIDSGIIPPEFGWPPMLDILTGSVDRADLEHEYMAPERMLWAHYGIPWIRKLAHDGLNIPEHPLMQADKSMEDDIEDDLKKLDALREQLNKDATY
jgi:hypothetical protein